MLVIMNGRAHCDCLFLGFRAWAVCCRLAVGVLLRFVVCLGNYIGRVMFLGGRFS